MNRTVLKIKESRADLSDYLFHFTNCSDAKDTLVQIIEDKKLKDINNRGFICFTETPIYAMIDMFKIFEDYPCPMYAPYGIGLPKESLLGMGARPVIYGSADELSLLDKSIRWRFEEYSAENDFTWLREWRVPIEEIEITPENCFIITKTREEELYIANDIDVDVDFDYADGQHWGYTSIYTEREWKSISIETLLDEVIDNNQKLKKEIEDQSIGDKK